MNKNTKGKLESSTEARNLIPGKRYHFSDGEVQKDEKTGLIFWRRADGSIQQINPHPSALFMVVKIDPNKE